MPMDVKNSIILPNNSNISKLILRHIHQQVRHCGRGYILSRISQCFLMPCANALARKIIKSCIFCRHIQAKPAIHLEVASNLDTASCINALRRFICVQYQNGGDALKELDHKKFHSTLQNAGVKRKFNLPSGAYHGGARERIIWLVKKVLASVLN
ncbi:hypothetical protein N1851_008520 [Merluccius polli]|uniref:Integrase zinc-binding domain-containing protein n=1 Tax=Merluccius polli TaxID=89951 RepID=A0AA47P4D8_MERPO|nr:hypothetical protein N1851_008520 [Merluccius polli]